MPVLRFQMTTTFSSAMDQLRKQAFPEERWSGSSRDEFDDSSLHIGVTSGTDLAAYGRLTPSICGCFRKKFGTQAVLPPPEQSVDLGRIAVSLLHRGCSLSELVLLESLLHSCDQGYGFVVGSCRPDSAFKPLLLEVGFVESGDPVRARYNKLTLELQPLVLTVSGNHAAWKERKTGALQKVARRGYRVDN